jgi:hypothetical protein
VSRRLSQKKGPAGASTSSSAYNAAAVSGVDRSARRSPAKPPPLVARDADALGLHHGRLAGDADA